MKKTPIDQEFVLLWSPRYDGVGAGNDNLEYDNLLKEVSRDIVHGHISEQTFKRVLNWKSPRLKGIVRLDQFECYNEGIKQALIAPGPEKLRILDDLYGIGVPVASTILHFIYPDTFPIMDIRVTEALCDFGHLTVKSRSQTNYKKFHEIILKIVKETNCSIRELDRALFAYHKLVISPRGNKGKHDCCGMKKSM